MKSVSRTCETSTSTACPYLSLVANCHTNLAPGSRRIAFFKIEQQLHIRQIPYKPVASVSGPSTPVGSPSAIAALSLPSPAFPSTSSRPHLLSESSPYLVIQSSDLLRSTSRVAYPNIAVQCSLKGSAIRVCLAFSKPAQPADILKQTTLHVRFRDLALVKPDPSELPSSMTYNPKTSVITFTWDDIDTCVPTFLTCVPLSLAAFPLLTHLLLQSLLDRREIHPPRSASRFASREGQSTERRRGGGRRDGRNSLKGRTAVVSFVLPFTV